MKVTVLKSNTVAPPSWVNLRTPPLSTKVNSLPAKLANTFIVIVPCTEPKLFALVTLSTCWTDCHIH